MKAAEIQSLLPGVFQRTIGACEFYCVQGAGIEAMNGIYNLVDGSRFARQGDVDCELRCDDLGDNRGAWKLTKNGGQRVVYQSSPDPQSGQLRWKSVDGASDPAPEVFAGHSNPLHAFLNVMELMHAPAEEAVTGLDRFLDPRRTPDAFVPLLARWMDLDRFVMKRLRGKDATADRVMPTGLGRLRELIANAAYLSKWRGTKDGLLRFLETAIGQSGFSVDEQVPSASGRSKPFHIRVTAPSAVESYRDLVREIIESEKPAYVTYELEFSSTTKESVDGKDL